jgi:hypothetical protein
MGTPLRRAGRVDLRGALLCDRPADFTVMPESSALFCRMTMLGCAFPRTASRSIDSLALPDEF